MIELSEAVRGPVFHSYAVQEKVQEAEIDPGMIIDEDELFAIDAWEPCNICGTTDESHESMTCDGCNKFVHSFCAGFDDTPEVWYCQTCLQDLENDTGLPGMASAVRRRPRRRAAPRQPRQPRQPRSRQENTTWARIWQEVSNRVDIDLDFPFNADEEEDDERTEYERRELAMWARRLEVGGRQGATHRLREIANARLRTPEPIPRPRPESQEELRAWNAFEKARETQNAPGPSGSRKRKASSTHSSPRATEATEQYQPKRPRLRRPRNVDSRPAAESSSAAAQRDREAPNFLASLLHEVENTGNATSASSPDWSDQQSGQYSPRDSSPNHSPLSSGRATPTDHPATPPPRGLSSPVLSSAITPMIPPLENIFSPCSPSEDAPYSDAASQPEHTRQGGRQRRLDQRLGSASNGLSFSAKREIQRMVKLALGSRYRDKQITKDQYTDINRDVSRKLYDQVGNASALSNQKERERWQETANDEVRREVLRLTERSPSIE